MKHLIWIAITAALVSFTAVEQFSSTGNARRHTTVSTTRIIVSGMDPDAETGTITSLFSQLETSTDQISILPTDTAIVVENGFSQTGVASYYANKFHGRRTSSGAIYHKDSMTCAHHTLKFGTIIRVTNLANDSTVIVKVTDRMGKTSHILDLSLAGAKQLNLLRSGIAKVKIEEVRQPLLAETK
jgi:rare lipoprotein A